MERFQKPQARCQEIHPIYTSPWPLSMAVDLGEGRPVIAKDGKLLT